MTDFLSRFAGGLARFTSGVGRVGAWAAFALMLVISWDVIVRKFFNTGSTRLQEIEWHLHAVLFLLCLGYGYLADSHVRIDLIRDRLSRRGKLWIELIGCVAFLLPFFLVSLYFGIDFVRMSYEQGEGSPNVGGLPHWWVIKSVMVFGFVLVILAGVSVLIRTALALFAGHEEAKPEAPTPDIDQ